MNILDAIVNAQDGAAVQQLGSQVGLAEAKQKVSCCVLPGIAIARLPPAISSAEIARFEISSGPQLRPSALPASSRT